MTAATQGSARVGGGAEIDALSSMSEDNRPIWEKVISSIEKDYTYASGPKAGEVIRLLDHEREFLISVLKPEIKQGALSLPRGNNKTGLISMIAAEAVAGELVQPGAHVLLVAASIDQGITAFEDVVHYVKCKHGEEAFGRGGPFKKTQSATQASIKTDIGPVALRVMGKEPAYAHGKRVSIALCDEPAKWLSSHSQLMYNAVKTSLGKLSNSKLIAIGTMPESDEHWFALLFKSKLEHIHSLKFAHVPKRPDEQLWKKKYWLPVNPLAEHNPELLDQLRTEAEEYREGMNQEAFKALRLNMGTAETAVGEPLLQPEEIDNCCTDDLPSMSGGHILGVDLGSRSALSSATAVFATGRCATVCIYPKGTGKPPGSDNEKHEAIIAMESKTPIPSAKSLLQLATLVFGEPVCIVADNYRSKDLSTACTQLNLPEPVIEHDTLTANEFVEHLRAACREGLLKWQRNGIIHSAIKRARMAMSNDGFKKMARHDQAGRSIDTRDDPIAALLPAAYHQAQALSGNYAVSEIVELHN